MNYTKLHLGNNIFRWFANPETWLELILTLEEGGTWFDYDPNAEVSEEINEELNLFL